MGICAFDLGPAPVLDPDRPPGMFELATAYRYTVEAVEVLAALAPPSSRP